MDGGPPASSAAAGSVASANKSIEKGGAAVGTVDHEADEVVGEDRIERLPARVQEALGELAGAAKEGLLALSVGVGLGVLHESRWRPSSRRSSARKASTCRAAQRCVTGTRAARSRSEAGVCR